MSMNCEGATAPINISGNKSQTCSMKCAYSFSYPLTNLTLSNNGDYLLFKPEPQKVPPVVFNNAKYLVEEMRLYQPSLHEFGGQKTDAELVIIHDNTVGPEGKLIVSIPVIKDGPVTDGTGILTGLIDRAAQSAPAAHTNAGVVHLPTFTFGKLIPYSVPFYSYTGTLPYRPCLGKHNIIVFPENHGVGLDGIVSKKLQNIIEANNYETKKNDDGLFINDKGASSNTSSGGDIYIECQPTGEDGEMTVHKKVSKSWLDELESKSPNAMKVGKAIIIALAVGVLVYFIWKMIGKFGTQQAGGGSQPGGASGQGAVGQGATGQGAVGQGAASPSTHSILHGHAPPTQAQ